MAITSMALNHTADPVELLRRPINARVQSGGVVAVADWLINQVPVPRELTEGIDVQTEEPYHPDHHANPEQMHTLYGANSLVRLHLWKY